jgi:hypothetical protein
MRAREQRRDGERGFARGRVVRLRWASVAKEYRFMARPTRYGAQGRSARSASSSNAPLAGSFLHSKNRTNNQNPETVAGGIGRKMRFLIFFWVVKRESFNHFES